MALTVAIIGAGSSGLPAIKSCLEEGLNPTCYEETGQVGGLWNYVEEEVQERGTVFRGVITNTSRDMTAYSDFPQPESNPLYLPHDVYAKYLLMYAENFHLLEMIVFHHKVIEIKKTPDHRETGRWMVKVKDLKSDNILEQAFDKVIVASGHHAFPFTPTFQGQQDFKGQQLHSHQYRKPEVFEGKKIVVVGFGNSGCDVSAECAVVGKEVRLSTRQKGGWIIPRVISTGLPFDAAVGRRSSMLVLNRLPSSWVNTIFENLVNNAWDHERFGLKPKHRILNHFPTINDRFPMEVAFGKIKIMGGIERLTQRGVIFNGSDEEVPTDVIIYATGFRPLLPYLKNVIDLEEKHQTLFKLVFPIELSKNSLAIVGLVDSDGRSTLALSEIQSRWVAQVFSGKKKLPSIEEMKKDNLKEFNMRKELLGEGHRMHFFVHSTEYLDEVAAFAGVKPNLWKILFVDPKLYWAVLTGPFLTSQFRLQGPHTWGGARNVILSYEKRLKAVTAVEAKNEGHTKFRRLALVLATSVVLIYGYKTYVGRSNYDLWQQHLARYCNWSN